ncbi:MAG: SET domain-containing protein [Blastocatellia bacterium]
MTLSSLEDFRVLDLEGKGAGLLATRPFKCGDGIYAFDYWSKEVMPMHLTNHSCDPNASFNEEGILVALREIAPGEEITFDYLRHPIPASPWNFECHCRSENCIGWIAAAPRG